MNHTRQPIHRPNLVSRVRGMRATNGTSAPSRPKLGVELPLSLWNRHEAVRHGRFNFPRWRWLVPLFTILSYATKIRESPPRLCFLLWFRFLSGLTHPAAARTSPLATRSIWQMGATTHPLARQPSFASHCNVSANTPTSLRYSTAPPRPSTR